MKKILLTVCLLSAFLAAPCAAQKILIHMDLQQSDHLKAYGIAYWSLENGITVEWLLNSPLPLKERVWEGEACLAPWK